MSKFERKRVQEKKPIEEEDLKIEDFALIFDTESDFDENEFSKSYGMKILVVGEKGAGKTKVIWRFVKKVFSTKKEPTCGVDFALKKLQWDENTFLKLQFWDTAASERYNPMFKSYSKNIAGAILVIDGTAPFPLQPALEWKDQIARNCGSQIEGCVSIPVILLVNKIDQIQERNCWEDQKQVYQLFCQQHGFRDWFEVSAKSGVNVDRAINFLSQEIIQTVDSPELLQIEEQERNDGHPRRPHSFSSPVRERPLSPPLLKISSFSALIQRRRSSPTKTKKRSPRQEESSHHHHHHHHHHRLRASSPKETLFPQPPLFFPF